MLVSGCTINEKKIQKDVNLSGFSVATFAGGCFWCMEAGFQEHEGVKEVISGYCGGESKNPTYENIGDHMESIQVYYDSEEISYYELLNIFWVQIDPTDADGQFADRGDQYKTAIFYHDDEQKKIAELSLKEVQKKFDEPIVTLIVPYKQFYDAEEYHQDYYLKQSKKYNIYKKFSGREAQIKENEKKLEDLNDKLTKEQYAVTQQCGTEPAFKNEYWDLKEDGIYVDIVTGEPLFSSLDKFDSGTGWPSFTKALNKSSIYEKEDNEFGMKRTEVRTESTHLGHIFDDGPNNGERYCINSASLKFIPKKKLVEEGYDEYLELFE